MNVKTRKSEQSEATRAALMTAARELFTERGYGQTSTEEIVRRARVTRGALYHHFRDKADLFAAVAEELSGEILARAKQAAMSGGPRGTWDNFVAGCQGFLDACLEPPIRQIVLIDGPSALGWERCRALTEKYCFAVMQAALTAAVDAGLIARQPVEPLAHMLVGALNQAALAMVRADDPEKARAETGAAVERLLEGFRDIDR